MSASILKQCCRKSLVRQGRWMSSEVECRAAHDAASHHLARPSAAMRPGGFRLTAGLARPVDSFPWRPASPECGKPRQPDGRLFLSHPGASREFGGRIRNRTHRAPRTGHESPARFDTAGKSSNRTTVQYGPTFDCARNYQTISTNDEIPPPPPYY